MEIQDVRASRAREGEAHGIAYLFGVGQAAVVFPDRLEDHLTLLALPSGARELFRVLYRFARWSLSNGQVTEDGQIRIWPKLDTLVRLTASSRSTIKRGLRTLADAGLCARVASEVGAEADCLLWPVPVLMERLDARPGAETALREMNPAAYDDSVRALEQQFVRPYATEWIVDQQQRTKALLTAAAAGAAQHTTALTTRRARGRPARPKAERRDGPVQWAEAFRRAIKDGLESVWQPTITKKDLALLKRLGAELEEHAPLPEFFTWVCHRERWPRLRRQLRLPPAAMPSVGTLWIHRASLIPAFLEDRSSTSSEAGRFDF